MQNPSSTPIPVGLVPEIGSCYKHGWNQLWKYFLELFLILIVTIIIQVPGGAGGWIKGNTSLNIFGFIYGIFIGGPVDFGVSWAYLKAARGEKVEVTDMFEGFKTYWNSVLASLLVSVIVLGGLILLIVPGIIFACKLAFTPYLVVDRKMEVIAAIKESWRMTNGHALDIFLMGLLSIVIALAGILALGVGIIISIMWISMAFASLYHAVSMENRTPGTAPI
jgi:uncharacterized membrane protein